MGKPALLELLNLIELKLEDDPVLAYQTLLELISFVKSNIQYQTYLPTLESIESSYQSKVMPQLLTTLPISYFHGQSINLCFQIPVFLKNRIRFQSDKEMEIKDQSDGTLTISYFPINDSPLTIECFHDHNKLKTFNITLVPPVEMDNLGL